MSTHGGEGTWAMTLKNIGAKLENMRNQIPEKDKKPKERREREKEEKFPVMPYSFDNMQ